MAWSAIDRECLVFVCVEVAVQELWTQILKASLRKWYPSKDLKVKKDGRTMGGFFLFPHIYFSYFLNEYLEIDF